MNGLQDQLEFGDDGWTGHQEKGIGGRKELFENRGRSITGRVPVGLTVRECLQATRERKGRVEEARSVGICP